MGSAGKKFTLFLLGLFILALLIRMIGIGTYMTVDEEKWMIRSGEFYEKMFTKNDPGGTFTTTHPGATTQWLAGLGISWQEKQLGIGVDTSNLDKFRFVSTIPIAIAISALIAVAAFLIARLMGYWVGVWAGLLLATEPYLVGMSQVVHVDMLLALFMLAAALCILIYLEEKRLLWIATAGIFTGLSFGTKLMPAIWLVVFFGIVMLFSFSKGLRHWKKNQIMDLIRVSGFFVGITIITFYLVWPALWVKTNLDSYYQQDAVVILTQEHIAQAESADPIQPMTFYIRTVFGRTTPFVLFLAFGIVMLTVKYLISSILFKHFVGRIPRHDNMKNKYMFVSVQVITWLFVYSAGYLLLINIAAKKADRYALPALVALSVLAAAGLVVAWPVIKEKIKLLETRKRRNILISLIVTALLLQPISWAPYMISYNSDLFKVRPMSQQGWGEGLDAAAQWINDSPLVDRLTIASWYPGVMRTYFKGKTMSLSSRNDDRVGYVVTYRNMGNRAPDDIATNVLDEFKNKEPVHTIKIGSEDYVYIYETLGLHYFPKNIGELTGGQEVGQIVTAPKDWSSIEIGMSNFSSRENTKEVTLHIRKGVNDTEDIRTVSINASNIKDGQWHRFTFDAIKGSAGEEYYVSLTSPQSVKGDAVTVRFVDRNIYKGEMVWRNRQLKEAEKNDLFIKPGHDLGYRLPTM